MAKQIAKENPYEYLESAPKEYYEENSDKFTFFDFDFEDRRKKNNPFYHLQEGE